MRKLICSLVGTSILGLLLFLGFQSRIIGQEFIPEKTFYLPVKQGKALGFFIEQNKLAVIFVKDQDVRVIIYYLDKTPNPNPEPNPEPNPNPSPTDVVAIYWVEETLERTPDQAKIIASKRVRDLIKQKGLSFQVVDKDVKNEFGETPSNLVPIISSAKKLPSLVLLNKEGEITVLDIPNNEDEFIELLGVIK